MIRDWPGVRRVVRLPLGGRRVRDDVAAELHFHLQGRIDELVAQGMSRDAAAAEAERSFGDYTRIEAEMERIDKGMNRRRSLAERGAAVMSDVRYAMRTLRRQPLFAAIIVLTLTLGIGATTAIFTVVDGVVLHPLPYPHADRVVYLGADWGKNDYADALSPRKFVFWHDQSHVFDALATMRSLSGALDAGTGPNLHGLRITEDFFRVVGMYPSRGRAFTKDDFSPGAPPVVILGHALWTTRFGADPRAIGRVIQIDAQPYTVIGVLPASFDLAEQSEWSQFLTPLSFTEENLADKGNNYTVMGRLRAGIDPSQVSQDMARVFTSFREAYPQLVDKGDAGVRVLTYREIFVGSLAPVLWILLGATLFVLLLACANVATLLLARALNQQREFAVRTALGAGRGRIVRQVCVEALLLGLVSAVLASVVSIVGVRALTALVPGGILRPDQLGLDPRVLLYTTVIGVVASLAIGVAVALPATRIDLAASLGEAARGRLGSLRQRAFRNTLVATESAIAMLLLAGAALLIASLMKLRGQDPGFRRDGMVTARIGRAPAGYDSATAVADFQQRVVERLRSTPGITSAGAASSLPLVRGWNTVMTLDGNIDATEGGLEWRAASDGYFQTFGIPILRGRGLTAADTHDAPPVVVVSESFARKYWPNESPLGHRIWVGRFKGRAMSAASDEPPREIVGVVADMKDIALDQSRPRHTVWVPQAQAPRQFLSLPVLVVHAADAAVAATALRNAISQVDPRMPTPDITSMNDVVSQSLAMRRFSMVLMSIFAALALGLTSIGIYGVVRYSVERRVHEIGVRMALGARPGRVVGTIVAQGLRPVAIGLVVGLGASLMVSRVLTKMLWGVSPRDPLVLGAVLAILASVAAVASYLPAHRATRIDPLAALRSE